MTDQPPLRVAIIGIARRSDYLYGPLLHALEDVALVAVWGRSADSARALGESLGVPWYTDLEPLVRETESAIGIVSVAYAANGEVGLMAVEVGLHVLLETPIAHHLHEADAIIRAAAQRNLKVEVAEPFHRRPLEQIKLKGTPPARRHERISVETAPVDPTHMQATEAAYGQILAGPQ